jgi:hypothetical protein
MYKEFPDARRMISSIFFLSIPSIPALSAAAITNAEADEGEEAELPIECADDRARGAIDNNAAPADSLLSFVTGSFD